MVTSIESYDLFESEAGCLMEANEEQRMNFKFSIAGWVKEQPIVDDTVIREIARDWKSGLIRFTMQMRNNGNFEFDEWIVPCIPVATIWLSSLRKSSALSGVVANLIHGEARECSSFIEYQYVTSVYHKEIAKYRM